jgi:parallel beta-helix repeat protein
MKCLKMNEKQIVLLLFLMLVSMFVFVKPVSSQPALQTIFIQPDGTVYPATAAIQRNGNIYTLTDNLYAAIKIMKSNIVLNGAGFTISGPYNGTATYVFVIGQGPNQLSQGEIVHYVIGVDLANSSVNGVTIENLNIENFSIGAYMWTQNDTVIGNSVSDNIVGILLSGSNNTLTKNIIANNTQGLFFGFNTPGEIPNDLIISENSFDHNIVQFSGCQCKPYNLSETPHDWDNGKIGNYWSDYNGTDANHDGIGDTPYIIDPVEKDRYPLMQSSVKQPVPVLQGSKIPFEAIVLSVSVSIVAVIMVFAVWQRKKRKRT